MRIALIEVPYDSGRFDERMGAGPRLLAAALPPLLAARGHDVEVEPVRAGDGFLTEVGAMVALQPLVRAAVVEARAAAQLPVVLSGNCGIAALGAMTALPPRTGVLWLDAHGDFNTPETTPTGFLDGMAIATLTGRCWPEVARGLAGFVPVADERIVLLGPRALDAAEEDALARSGIAWLSPAGVRDGEQVARAVERLAGACDGLYLHLDLDVLDAADLRANGFAAEGGLRMQEVLEAIAVARAARPILAVGVTAYDPRSDDPQRGADVAARLLAAVVDGVRDSAR